MTLKLNGTTSGSVSLDAPATGSDVSFTLPGSVGTSGQLLSTNGAGVLSFVNGGKILQIVRATDTTARTTTSTTYVDVTGMSITITPQKSDSAVLIIASVFARTSAASGTNQVANLVITDSSDNFLSGALTDFGVAAYSYSGSSYFSSRLTLIGYATDLLAI